MSQDIGDAQDGEGIPFVPFTKAERIQQLGEIDQSIVSLLRTVGHACESLTKTDTEPADTAMPINEGPNKDSSDVFEVSMKEFFRTLHSVDVRTKRQILGLEEAGIVTLAKEDSEEGTTKVKTKSTSSLRPDGFGKIGGFDAGWLNSRSNKVERDMESQLWDQAQALLAKLLDNEKKQTAEDSSQKTQ